MEDIRHGNKGRSEEKRRVTGRATQHGDRGTEEEEERVEEG